MSNTVLFLDDNINGAGGVLAARVVGDAAYARRKAARAAEVARRGPRAPHALREARAPLRPLRLRVRAPGGLRPADHLRQDHEADTTRGRRSVRPRIAAGQIPPAA